MTDYTKSFGATAYLTFNDTQIALTAADVKNPRFVYHAESFYTAASLGQLDNAITSISGKMQGVIGADTANDIKQQVSNLSDIPVLNQILR